jgi:hypothetical protein
MVLGIQKEEKVTFSMGFAALFGLLACIVKTQPAPHPAHMTRFKVRRGN